MSAYDDVVSSVNLAFWLGVTDRWERMDRGERLYPYDEEVAALAERVVAAFDLTMRDIGMGGDGWPLPSPRARRDMHQQYRRKSRSWR